MPRTPRPAARRGAVLPLFCILLTALLGAAALAIDLGRVHYSATEAQAAADAAALAAASGLQLDPLNQRALGPGRAQNVGARNRVGGSLVNVAGADIGPAYFDPNTRTVFGAAYKGDSANAMQVTVRSRVTYAIANAVGLQPVTVARSGTAWIANLTGAGCVRPLALPYTRIYEDIHQMTSRPFTSQNHYAPDVTQSEVATLSAANGIPTSYRTFVLIPPWEREAYWDSAGQPNSGSWHTVNYANQGYSAYTTFIGADVGSSSCALATTHVGDYLHPFVWTRDSIPSLLAYAKPGFVQLCNRAGNAADATCRTPSAVVGVKTRMALSDSIPNPSGGPFSQKVRMVTQLRVMCYFQSTSDVCYSAFIPDGGGTVHLWQMPPAAPGGQPVISGYPAGTVVVLVDAPVNVDITPDAVLGNAMSLSQRLILVR